MKSFGILSLILTVSISAYSQNNNACSDRTLKIMDLLRNASTCDKDSECIVTQKFSKKLVCGKNIPVNKAADLKKIFEVIESVRGCPEGGSCLHQDTKKLVKAKCIENQCQVIE